MMLYHLGIVFWLIFRPVCSYPLEINKCCPEGEKLDGSLKCAPIEEDEYEDELATTNNSLSWFPLESIVYTSEISKHFRPNWKDFSDGLRVNYGQIPNCSSEQTTQVAYYKPDVIELFHFILYENLTMRIHISKPGSMHYPNMKAVHSALVQEEREWRERHLIHSSMVVHSLPLKPNSLEFGIEKLDSWKSLYKTVFPCKFPKSCSANYSSSLETTGNNSPLPQQSASSNFSKIIPAKFLIYTPSNLDSSITFPLQDACVDLGIMNVHFLVFCPCRTKICMRKCCSDGKFYNSTSDECENFGSLTLDNWRPKSTGVLDQYYLLSDTFPSCENPLLLNLPDHAYKACNRFNKESDNDFTIYANGSVKVNKYKKPFETHQYCGEVTWHENGKVFEQNLILCSGLKHAEQSKSWLIKSIIYGTILIIGGICLLITVAVSLYLPELRRRMHNKIALSHNVSLMVAYFTWGIGQLSPDLGDKSCMLIALIIQFTFLGSFFWLNVMCIDISMTFSATRSLGGHSTVGDYKKFVYYCIYSWGTTTVISVITMIMEFLPDIPYDFLKPGFSCSCGFNTANASIIIYFYGPMSILLLFNLILFVYTTVKIMSVQRQTAILHKTDSNTTGGSPYQSDKQRYDLIQWLILYAKLFLLMGLTWITEIISWAVGGPDYYWYFSDILNLLRAVFIFILFICKKTVLESLKRKLKRDYSREGCSKSVSDCNSTSTSVRDSRLRSSTNSNKRKESAKVEAESQKLLNQRPVDVLPRNGGLEESCM